MFKITMYFKLLIMLVRLNNMIMDVAKLRAKMVDMQHAILTTSSASAMAMIGTDLGQIYVRIFTIKSFIRKERDMLVCPERILATTIYVLREDVSRAEQLWQPIQQAYQNKLGIMKSEQGEAHAAA
jgi:hypothetical protein